MIIWINGTINSGKTTISKLLACKISNTAHIEVDKLREFIEFMPLSDEVIEISLENAVSVARNFIAKDFNVIISYPLSMNNYDKIIEELVTLDDKIIFITLSPRIEAVLENRGSRELNTWETERIKHHYSTGLNTPKFPSIIIDNSDQTPEETVAEILKHL
ncbi:MAG: hypothetical protein WCI57_03380 [Candidatus Berkelbacteria bacterium]